MAMHDSAISEADVEQQPANTLRDTYLRVRSWLASWWRIAANSRVILPLLLMTIAIGIYLPRVTVPDKYLFDEVLFGYTAGEYIEGNTDAYRWDIPCSVGKNKDRCAEVYPPSQQPGNRIGRYEWTHPPVGKLAMSGGILLFGNEAFGWRIMSVVAGALGVAVVYQLGLMVTGRIAVGLLAAGLLLMDGMYFLYSRMALTDIFLVLFTTSSLLAFTWYLRAPPDRQRVPMLATGLLLGLGIATKWNAAYVALFVGLVIVGRFVYLWRESRKDDASAEVRRGAWHHLVWGPVALVAVPVTVYLAAYLPFFISGGNTWSDFIALQKEMFTFHTHLDNFDPPTASKWWSWPLDMRSVWFGTRFYEGERVALTFALGNPLLYWAFVPAIAWSLVRWWRSRNAVALTVLIIGFFCQWLPWVFVDRATFLYHFLPMVPFGCLALAATVVHICGTMKDWRRTLAIEYVVLIAMAFVFFYPIVSRYPISIFEMDLRMWLDSWRN